MAAAPNNEKLGYLGLGMMGLPMTRRLLKAAVMAGAMPPTFSGSSPMCWRWRGGSHIWG